MQNYIQHEKIGEGAYGIVYKAQSRATGHLVAIKQIRPNRAEEGVPSTVIREISFLRELKHPNIVALLEVLHTEKDIYLVFEYLTMDLRVYLDSLPPFKPMDAKMVKSYLYQVTNAILFCHRRRILHRDLKPENLLIDQFGQIKVCDFGLGRSFDLPMRPYTHEVVTLWYRAPEVLLGSEQYACPVDIWSIACIFFEMATGDSLFEGHSEIDQLFCIFRILGTPNELNWPGVSKLPDFKTTFPSWTCNRLSSSVRDAYPNNFSESAIDLLNQMLIYQPSKRIPADDILEHSYFKGFGGN